MESNGPNSNFSPYCSKGCSSKNAKEVFWLEAPLVLIQHITLIPNKNSSCEEKFNCLSRLVILITLIVYICKRKIFWGVLLIVLGGICALYYALSSLLQSIDQKVSNTMNIRDLQETTPIDLDFIYGNNTSSIGMKDEYNETQDNANNTDRNYILMLTEDIANKNKELETSISELEAKLNSWNNSAETQNVNPAMNDTALDESDIYRKRLQQNKSLSKEIQDMKRTQRQLLQMANENSKF